MPGMGEMLGAAMGGGGGQMAGAGVPPMMPPMPPKAPEEQMPEDGTISVPVSMLNGAREGDMIQLTVLSADDGSGNAILSSNQVPGAEMLPASSGQPDKKKTMTEAFNEAEEMVSK